MNCEEIRELIGAYADGELPRTEQRLVEQHASACENCQTLIDDAQKLSALIRSEPRFATPPELQSSITKKLGAVDSEPKNRIWRPGSILAVTNIAAIAAGILITLLTTHYFEHQDRMTDDLVTTHLRHTIREEFGIVASSDRHTIRPWFTGKIDYAPPVIDLAKAGFPLIAGRVEYINGRAVAALTYGRRKHQISLFVLPPEAKATDVLPVATSITSSRGFNIAVWHNKEFSFSAVSDVNINDLSAFADLILAALDDG